MYDSKWLSKHVSLCQCCQIPFEPTNAPACFHRTTGELSRQQELIGTRVYADNTTSRWKDCAYHQANLKRFMQATKRYR